jgi:hypothetical protein
MIEIIIKASLLAIYSYLALRGSTKKQHVNISWFMVGFISYSLIITIFGFLSK